MTTSSVLTTPPGDRWKHAPATGEPDRWNLDGWDPFTDDPTIPDGYEQVPHTGDGWRSSFSIRPVRREEPQETAEVPPTGRGTEFPDAGRRLPPAAETPTATTPRKKPAAKAKPHAPAPKPKTLYREPADQAEHRRAVRDVLRGKGIVRAVALEAHDQIGMTYAERKGRTPFGEVRRELTPDYLAGFLGFGVRKIRDAMAEAVAAGLFVRVDNGMGGRNNTNRATYRAVVPELWNPAPHARHEMPTLD